MEDLIKHLPAVIYEYTIHPNGKGCFTYISPSSESILGLSAEAILKDDSLMDSLVHEDDLGLLQDTSLKSQENASDWAWEGRMIINGRQRWIEARSNHETKPDGTIIRRGILQDITERRLSAKESEIRYQTLVKRLPIGILIYVNQKIVFSNDTAHQILGVSAAKELLGADPADFLQEDSAREAALRLKQTLEGKSIPVLDQTYRCKDGRVVDVEEMAFPFTYKGVPAVQVIFRDITEKKVTEARIRKNETLFTRLFNSIPLATVMLDELGKVKQINRGFLDMFGYEQEELFDHNLNDFIVPDELRSEGIGLNNLIAASRIISVVTVRRHKQGGLVNVILYGVPVMQDNETIGVFGVYVDITERMKVEEELKIRNAELDNFVYKVSHDLRAPLSSILGLVNLAKLPGNPDDLIEYIDIIGEKVSHLDHFISDVLSHSKNLKMEVSIGKVDLDKIIDRTFKDLDYLEGAKDMVRYIKIEGTDFYSDPWRISEIFRNLISNAIKYRQLNKSRQPEISIEIHVDNLRADISFADNGIGISQSTLNRIFEMFFRATEQSDGSGIGLYIVKNAVEKLGGQIAVTSEHGEGTRFHIVLPNRISSPILQPYPSLPVEPRQ